MEKTKIIIVRHGESLGNAARYLLGHTDLDLSEQGKRQAEATAERLSEEKIDAVYTSDLIRAYNTALPHATRRGLTPVARGDLRELYLGEWEHRAVTDVIQSYGNMYVEQWQNRFPYFTPPGGEAVMKAGERFYNAVLEIARLYPGKTVLIAAHGAVIRAFWAIITRMPPDEVSEKLPYASNGSYSVVDYDGEFIPVSYSNDSHLLDIGITNVIKV